MSIIFIIGMMKTIITLMYDDETTSKDDDDNLIKDQDIQEAAIKVKLCDESFHVIFLPITFTV